MVKVNKLNVGLVLAGFLAGTLGVKALKSAPAKKLAVGAVAQGLKVKAGAESLYEEGKAQVDDILAEAEYLNSEKAESKAPAAGGELAAQS
jgi:hypothetical protein